MISCWAWLCVGLVNAQTFGNVNIGGGGFVTAVLTCATQKNLIYCRTDVGGAYRWDDAGQSWTPLLDWTPADKLSYQGVESFAIDPQAPNKLYLFVGTSYWNGGTSAILRSNDYGKTFAITDVTDMFKANGNGADRQKGEMLAVDPNKGSVLFCGSRGKGLFKSTNSGASWRPVKTFPNVGNSHISFVQFDKSFGKQGEATPVIYVGVFKKGKNLFVSRDAGETWSAISPGMENALPQRCALASDSSLYITYGNWESGAIYRYKTHSGIWSNCTPYGVGRTFCGISVDPNDPEKIIASTYGHWEKQPWGHGDVIFTSTDGGDTWKDLSKLKKIKMDTNGFPWINKHAIHWACSIELDPFNSNRAFVTSGNGIFCCNNVWDDVTEWKFMCKGLEETVPFEVVSIPNGPLVSVIGDYDGFVHHNINESPKWGRHSPAMGSTTAIAVAAKNTQYMVRSAKHRYYSEDQGHTWKLMGYGPDRYMKDGHVAVSANATTVLWNAGNKQRRYITLRTTDNGQNWSECKGLEFASKPVADPENDAIFYAYNNASGYLYVSTDGGETFAPEGYVGGGGSTLIRTVLQNEGHIWVAKGNGGLAYSINKGKSFSVVNSVNTCAAVGLGKAAPGSSYPTIYIWGTIFGSDAVGLYRSTDAGKKWVRINNDAHQYGGPGNAHFVVGDENVYGRVYMSTAGRGIVYIDSANKP